MASGLKIGWVGTGVMGASMCRHLLDAGLEVTVTTRTKSKAADLLGEGAQWGDSPAEVAAASDFVFAIVGLPADVREVFLGPSGLLAGASAGTVLVDMTTSEPSLAAEIHAAGAEKSVECLDAPVSGGDVGARNAALSIMVGGESAAVDRAMPLFGLMGQTIVHQGGPGAGQHTKMVNQILIASGMIGIAEGLNYAKKAGLDPQVVLESVSGGAAGSWSLSNLGPRILRGDFDPGFFIDHFVKDMTIAVEESHALGVAVPGLELALAQYQQLQAEGDGALGTQALATYVGRRSQVDW